MPSHRATLYFFLYLIPVFFAAISLSSSCAFGAEKKPTSATSSQTKKPDYEDEFLRIRLIRRSPKQIAAFYEGRQFPAAAVLKVSQVCFVAAIVHNKTPEILWLDLDKWKFKGKREISRLDRDYWKQQWQQANVDKASQATFGWTLLPEKRDLRADEGVGGNITLPQQKQEFTIIAHFDRGAERQLSPVVVTLNHISCKQDENTK